MDKEKSLTELSDECRKEIIKSMGVPPYFLKELASVQPISQEAFMTLYNKLKENPNGGFIFHCDCYGGEKIK